ncbi:restriction endonuclease [Alphaproteobacteria bacterium]|nr:restriction endonuclease [Alphaproteobacteria bacterium]
MNDKVVWSKLHNNKKWKSKRFSVTKPSRPNKQTLEPWEAREYQKPKVPLFQKLLGQGEKFKANHLAQFESENEQEKKENKAINNRIIKKNNKLEQKYNESIKSWEKQKKSWEAKQLAEKKKYEDERELHNLRMIELQQAWENGRSDAVVEHSDLVLSMSVYPEFMEPTFNIQFDSESRILKVEYYLPSPEIVRLQKTARFIATSGEISETFISEREQKRIFDDVCYQIAIRTAHELFEADEPDNISSVLFNGVVNAVDGATGLNQNKTIMSAIFDKQEFEKLNLSAVDPKACFKNFKGVSASSLIALTPVAPIIEMEREDKRFVDSKSGALDGLNSVNLASMDWEEFEHLVRELFEKEFNVRGGEVKVTQASADGGVDAIAFDPDPISGGKMIIQAKRYTKTVPVSAVRELFGTVVNEGATKGILVTTADYGTDAHKFAADKPITLLSGGNLLHLIEKHGFKGRIDIKEARKEMGLR